MTNEIVARAVNDLQRIGLPGSAERLQMYIAELEERVGKTCTLDSQRWRYVFAGQFMAAQISIGDGVLPEDYVHAAKRADALLAELERAKRGDGGFGSTGL